MMLPNGWKKVGLFDVVSIESTLVDPKKQPYSEMNLIAPDHIQSETGVILALVPAKEQHAISGKYLVKKGDVIYSKIRPYLKKACCATEECLCSADMYPFTVSDQMDASYLLHMLLSETFTKYANTCSARTGIPKINREDLALFQFYLPPIEEQKKIAATLSVWDTAIEKMEELIETKSEQKKSLTYKLIENQNDVKFKLGNVTIDKSKWNKKSLKEMGSFSKGQGIKRDEALSGSIAAVRYGEIYTTHNDYIKEFHSFISKDVAKKSKLLKKGDLLFSCSGETKEDIGKCVAFVSDVVAYAGGDIIIFSPQIECDSKYLGFLLNSRSINKQKYGLGQGDSIVHISAESIGRLTVFLPSYPEQKAIADVLSAIDDELFLLKQQLENYKKQKQGLMQKLLTGQWRVK